MTPVDAIWLFLVKTYSLCPPLRGYPPSHPVGVLVVLHMKKFAEVCLYNQCIIFIAAAINHVNINVY